MHSLGVAIIHQSEGTGEPTAAHVADSSISSSFSPSASRHAFTSSTLAVHPVAVIETREQLACARIESSCVSTAGGSVSRHSSSTMPHATASLVVFNASPERQVYDDLHRMKQLLETGEVTRSDAVPQGFGPVRQHAAQGESR